MINKLNPDAAPMMDLIEKDVGKNIHTLLILLDELISSIQDIDVDTNDTISSIKDILINVNNTIKNRLTLHFVENIEYCSTWLKKLEEKVDQKEKDKENDKDKDKKESEHKEKEIEPPLQKERSQPSRKEISMNKFIEKDSESEHSKESNEKADEEFTNGVPSHMEEEKHNPEELHLQATNRDFDEFRAKQDHSTPKQSTQMKTTSTNLPKPKPKSESQKKSESKHKEVVNPVMRKKICVKMAKIIQDKHKELSKENVQELTLKIENKIRNINPDMGQDYRDNVIIVLKLIKFSLLNLDDFLNNSNIDFSDFKERVDSYQKQHGEANLDTGLVEDSPSLNRDARSENENINGENMSADTSN